ncbi:MAG: hypothetical protein CME19_07545 [Gemmatimonadetes bacterium]|nr:hypothetical protein [Gemmatimonadota bacterium]
MSEQLLNPNLIHVAGWTLVHFPWQACLIGLLVGAAGRLLKNHEASWRYGVACAALLAVVLSAVTTVVLLSVYIGPSRRSIFPFPGLSPSCPGFTRAGFSASLV